MLIGPIKAVRSTGRLGCVAGEIPPIIMSAVLGLLLACIAYGRTSLKPIL